MTNTIPNLWPVNQVKTDVLTPLAILRVQATNLQQMTQGILIGKVGTVTSEQKGQIHFDIVVPALRNYTHRLLSATYDKNFAYPVDLESEYSTLYPKDSVAYTQEQFVRILGHILESAQVVSIVQSLIARSNEATGEVEAEDADQNARMEE